MTYVMAILLRLNSPSIVLAMQANKNRQQKSACFTIISAVPIVVLVAQLVAMEDNDKTRRKT